MTTEAKNSRPTSGLQNQLEVPTFFSITALPALIRHLSLFFLSTDFFGSPLPLWKNPYVFSEKSASASHAEEET